MYVCVSDFDPPDTISMNATIGGGQMVVKVEQFSADVTLNDRGNGTCFNSDYEVWMTLRQGQVEQKIGEIDLDTEFWIEEWDGSSITTSIPVETDSSQILDPEYRDQDITFTPGEATLYVSGRGGAGGVVEPRTVNLVANFPTMEDVTVANVNLGQVSNGQIPVQMQVDSPVPFGTQADIQLTGTLNGQNYFTDTVTRSISGVLNLGSVNTEELSVSVPAPSGFGTSVYGTVEVCGKITNITR